MSNLNWKTTTFWYSSTERPVITYWATQREANQQI